LGRAKNGKSPLTDDLEISTLRPTMMNHTARLLVFAVFSASIAFCAKADNAAPIALPLEHGYIVLRNGEVLEGKISLDDDIYCIGIPNGEIRIRKPEVDLVCKDLEEGYRRKREVIQVGNIHQHLELAQWCLHQNLLGPAGVEISAAAAVDPKNPMVGILQSRLKLALEPPPPSSAKSQMCGPSNEELDRMIRGMPHGVVEGFTQSIQPMLLNNCASSGCHSPQSDNGFKLYRISTDRVSNRRTTQRNLYSVLQFVDLRNLATSKLLSAATQPHGTVQHAVFSERQTPQLRRMGEWLALFAQPTPLQTPNDPGVLPLTAQPMANNAGGVLPASYNEPTDPFDPDAFNRGRTTGRGKTLSQPSAPATQKTTPENRGATRN
jgi:hypothetical protein